MDRSEAVKKAWVTRRMHDSNEGPSIHELGMQLANVAAARFRRFKARGLTPYERNRKAAKLRLIRKAYRGFRG